jgi:hypothetical protein
MNKNEDPLAFYVRVSLPPAPISYIGMAFKDCPGLEGKVVGEIVDEIKTDNEYTTVVIRVDDEDTKLRMLARSREFEGVSMSSETKKAVIDEHRALLDEHHYNSLLYDADEVINGRRRIEWMRLNQEHLDWWKKSHEFLESFCKKETLDEIQTKIKRDIDLYGLPEPGENRV